MAAMRRIGRNFLLQTVCTKATSEQADRQYFIWQYGALYAAWCEVRHMVSCAHDTPIHCWALFPTCHVVAHGGKRFRQVDSLYIRLTFRLISGFYTSDYVVGTSYGRRVTRELISPYNGDRVRQPEDRFVLGELGAFWGDADAKFRYCNCLSECLSSDCQRQHWSFFIDSTV